jgi:hypothetical protein
MTTKKTTTSRAAKMREYFTANPLATPSEVAKKFKTTYQIAYMTKKGMEQNAVKDAERMYEISKGRKEQRMKILAMTSSNKSVEDLNTTIWDTPITMVEPQPDPVNHPAHYKVGGIETIDFIEAKKLNYNMGNAVKYISRADHKGNKKQDLEKAKWYIDRELAKT